MIGLIDDLDNRGLVADCTDRQALAELLATRAPVSAYAGYDPTAASLHIGHLIPTMMLRRVQLAGHRPIIVVGGATGMIGDPSGQSQERNLLDDATLATNVAGIRAQLERLLDFTDPAIGAVMTNNADWTRGLGFLEFLRDIGKHLTVNYMTAKDSVRARLQGDSGLSYTEFSYMLLQAFDFVHLSRAYGCRLQVGGSDQYGNITAGCELQRKLGGAQLFGLTAPLLLDASGQKMGKTSTGEKVWLDATRTSAYAFYQYWLNVSDGDAPRLLRMFSIAPLAELGETERAHDADRGKRLAQRELARAMTTWVHGAAVVPRVEAAARVMFGDELAGITDADLDVLGATIPSIELNRDELGAGIALIDLFVRAGLADSKGAARRLITQGGAYVNNTRIAEVDRSVTLTDLATETGMVLRSGRKDYRLVRAR
jgi:tyrosyl-tRNA synthetase